MTCRCPTCGQTISSEQFLASLPYVYESRPTSWRKGQAAFNYLCSAHPQLAERIRGTEADPFYDDMRLPTFEAVVRSDW